MVHRYGSLWGIPQGTTFMEDPVAPGRNLLASISPGNLNRFYNLRTLNFKYNPGRSHLPHLYLCEQPIRSQGVRRVLKLKGVTYVQMRQVQRHCTRQPLPPAYYHRRQGVSLYLGLPKPLKVYRVGVPSMTPVRPEDYTHLRIYNYFK